MTSVRLRSLLKGKDVVGRVAVIADIRLEEAHSLEAAFMTLLETGELSQSDASALLQALQEADALNSKAQRTDIGGESIESLRAEVAAEDEKLEVALGGCAALRAEIQEVTKTLAEADNVLESTVS